MTPEQVELKPCPFCGGEAKIIGPVQEGGYCVECPQCLASSKLMYPLMDDVSELLTEAWNTRHVAEGGGWQKTIGTWADATFPTSTQATIIAHLRAEANDEIGVDCDPMELADVGLLLLHLAHKRGVDLYELMREKHKINQSRKWEARPNDRGFMSHLPAPPACGEATRTTNIDEIVEQAMDEYPGASGSQLIRAAELATAAATAAERERCAKVCDAKAFSNPNTRHLGPEQNCADCAAAIRKGGQP